MAEVIKDTPEKVVSVNDFIRKRDLKKVSVTFEGFKAPFILTEITNEAFEAVQKESMRQKKNAKTGQVESTVDSIALGENLVARCVEQPDLNNRALQEAYGTLADPKGTLKAMLSLPEFNRLGEIVSDLVGVGENSVDAKVKEVKK